MILTMFISSRIKKLFVELNSKVLGTFNNTINYQYGAIGRSKRAWGPSRAPRFLSGAKPPIWLPESGIECQHQFEMPTKNTIS